MEYQVPQFIEVEDKIFGPFTFKQFVYIAGGAGVCAIAFFYLPLIFAALVILPVAALTGALAFYRVNNKPFEDILESGVMYYLGGSRLYLWKKIPKSEAELGKRAVAAPVVAPPRLGLDRGKLHDLAWSLDVKDTGQPIDPLD